MISLGEFILLSLIVLSAVLATVYLNRKLKEKGYRVNNLLNVLVVLTVSTALCLVGTSVAWILKGVAFALILLYASVEDFTKREADDCLWVMILLLCIALVVTFGVSPLVNRISDQKTDIVRVKNTIERGQQITANDLEIVRVGSYNLPDGVIKDGKSVVGKYATATLFAGDYLFSEKITGESNSAADILAALDGKKVAISVSIGSYADGLSGKLENGDIISIIIYNKEEYRSYICRF